ncbi:MAG: FtsQ-type POTRA domain-containing protein [Armatimonadetes bacterium]|nr:FtsQ-type POTRA domain-containing protein [Armatimonadota bacterium]
MRRTRSARRTTRVYNRRRPARNRRKFRLRRLLWPLMSVVILSGLAAGCYYILTCPELQVEHIKVSGTRLISRAQIESELEQIRGSNILILSKDRIIKRIRQHPEVLDVKVGRLLPDTVIVRIKERRRYVTIDNGRGFWLADRKGIPFHCISTPPRSVPVVAVPEGSAVAPGRSTKNVNMNDVLRCLGDCRLVGQKVTKISVDRRGNLCLNMGSGFYVKLGQPVDIREKLQNVSKILTLRPEIGESALYIDVSCSDAPVWKPRAEAEEEPVRNT